MKHDRKWNDNEGHIHKPLHDPQTNKPLESTEHDTKYLDNPPQKRKPLNE